MKLKYTRYTEDLIENIACDIEENRFLSASEASQNYGLDASGLIKHIKKTVKITTAKKDVIQYARILSKHLLVQDY